MILCILKTKSLLHYSLLQNQAPTQRRGSTWGSSPSVPVPRIQSLNLRKPRGLSLYRNQLFSLVRCFKVSHRVFETTFFGKLRLRADTRVLHESLRVEVIKTCKWKACLLCILTLVHPLWQFPSWDSILTVYIFLLLSIPSRSIGSWRIPWCFKATIKTLLLFYACVLGSIHSKCVPPV